MMANVSVPESRLNLTCGLCESELDVRQVRQFTDVPNTDKRVEFEVCCRDCDGLEDDRDAFGDVTIFTDGLVKYSGLPYPHT